MICLKYFVIFKEFADKNTIQNHSDAWHLQYFKQLSEHIYSGQFADNMMTGDNIG
jgi:hypothetical protein